MEYVDIWLCEDCTIAECNGDYSGMTDERAAEVEAGFNVLAAQGGHLSANFDCNADTDSGIQEFSWQPCDCCGSKFGGSRHRFAQWEAKSGPWQVAG